MRTALAWAVLLAACGPARASVFGLEAMRARSATFATSGFAVVVSWEEEPGANLVLTEPYVDGDRVVFGVLGVASAGRGGRRVRCVDVSDLALPADWERRLFWRGPDGALAPVGEVGRVAACPR